MLVHHFSRSTQADQLISHKQPLNISLLVNHITSRMRNLRTFIMLYFIVKRRRKMQ
jgi:hypothetical protein